MEIKGIFSRFKNEVEEVKETFLALEISTEIVKSAVWTVKEKKTAVLKVGSVEEWNEGEESTLITAADKSISFASEGIVKEPEKVIFGLPETWVKGNEIRETKKKILSHLAQKLALKPIGFVVVLEALITYLKRKEGMPVSAIFIHLSEVQATVSLVKLGQIKGSERVGRSDDLAADVQEGLARFKEVEDLPARIIIFNGIADFEEAKQQLISFDWPNNLPFLHFPKVEALPVSLPVKAVAIAGGTEAAKSLGFEIKEEEKEKQEDKETKKEFKQDVKEVKKELAQSKVEKEEVSFGFVQGEDIAEIDKRVEKQEKKEPEKTKPLVKKLFNQEKKIALRRFFLKFFHFPRKKFSFLIALAIVFLLFFASAGLAFYWYVPRAQVILYLKPQVLEKELKITIDPTATAIDKKNMVIPGSFKDIEVEASKTSKTSGEKLIGDRAKGEIVIYNKTDLEKTFPSGTILIGPKKLTFVLDEKVKVASSAAEEEGVTYGKKTALVSAVSIGTDSNLEKGTLLTFKDYPKSLYSAKVNNGLSGGTSRQVKAVSKEDLDSLLTELKKDLIKQAWAKLKDKVSSDEEVLEKEALVKILEKKYDHQEGEEGENLKLNLKLNLKFIVYKKADFNKFLKESISSSIPDNFIYSDEKTEIKTTIVKTKDNKADIDVLLKAKLIPQINKEQIKKDLKGRYLQVAQDYLQNLPSFSSADIKITPSLPAKLNTLPRKESNIKIEIKIGDK